MEKVEPKIRVKVRNFNQTDLGEGWIIAKGRSYLLEAKWLENLKTHFSASSIAMFDHEPTEEEIADFAHREEVSKNQVSIKTNDYDVKIQLDNRWKQIVYASQIGGYVIIE